MTKVCAGCGAEKDRSEFSKSSTSLDDLQTRCRECFKEYYRQNKDRYNARKRLREVEFKKYVIAQYGGKCVCCGETEYAFLVFDHVNDDGAEDRRTRSSYRHQVYRWAAMNGYPNTLQLLCANCNMAKQCTPGGCPHQGKG